MERDSEAESVGARGVSGESASREDAAKDVMVIYRVVCTWMERV